MSNSRSPFVALPLELIELIFDNISDPLDFCNASSTCKTLHSASSRLMKEHIVLAEKYQTLYFSTTEDGGTNVWAVLAELLKDWRIRYHIREVVFGEARLLHYDSLIAGDCSTLGNAINDMKQMDGFESLPIDPISLKSGYDDPFNALLVCQLQNLREITYVNDGHEEDFYRLIKEYDDASHPPFLTKLRTVNLEHWDTEGGLSLEWIIIFMRLPSVRTVNGHMIEAAEEDEIETKRKSNVTTLNLTYSCIELGAFDQLMEITQNLEYFSYEHSGAVVGDADCDPYGMVAVLLKHAGHSLKSLKINYGDEDDMFEYLTYCSIRDFKKLKVAELDHLTLVPYQQEIMNDADVDEPLSQGFYIEPEQRQDPGPSELDLANALPPTIQRLKVNRFPGPDGLPSLRHLLGKKEQGCFPDLKNISLDTFSFHSTNAVEWDDLQKDFARVGALDIERDRNVESGTDVESSMDVE
ncbi:hypothetical protein BLS_009581 [Venturia inaequalis]|uniref:F-box domain-containing protein n=1 Tax=Venturia inaequalis TaxID=5025 RepID=A0A8H3ZGM4_VENIN|nr:hypothetical protein BLS_009581 [Venturia inaequalis]KAE9991331.1 hypothetical protein EG327_011833 [Venturia inaequalis]